QEGSSKGVSASASVVDDEEALRSVVRELIDRYRQPALIEVYIPGREFTVGLLGDRRPRVLPPMEILFKDKSNQRPVYDFQIKQEWEKHVSYQCPAQLSPSELKAIERVCRETFAALDCRDVARVDLRVTPKGDIYVIEVNPLPGLTPGYSDLCLIASAAGIEYRTLIGEILEGGLKRLREKRREAKAETKTETKPADPKQIDLKLTDLKPISGTPADRPTANGGAGASPATNGGAVINSGAAGPAASGAERTPAPTVAAGAPTSTSGPAAPATSE
ncbi:MAG TPA: ATP-grasp domain-containing protein, partial [Polyangia bacterium]|nr:ATP-grasp domain-containing protein [Polyangia bacterium]